MSDFHPQRFVVLAAGGVRGRVWGQNFYRRSPIGKFLTQADASNITPVECRTKMPAPPTTSVVGFEPEGLPEAYCEYLHFAALEREVEDTLDVVSLREKIDEVRFLDAVSGLKQTSQITGEGSWITRNIGQPW